MKIYQGMHISYYQFECQMVGGVLISNSDITRDVLF